MLAHHTEKGLNYFTEIKDFERKVKWAGHYNEFLNLTRNDVISIIKMGLQDGWKKEIEHDAIYGIDVVKLVKGENHAIFGKLKSGEWHIGYYTPSPVEQIYHGD